MSWEALITQLSSTLAAGLIQFMRAINSVKNGFGLSLLDHSLEVLSTAHTARNLQ